MAVRGVGRRRLFVGVKSGVGRVELRGKVDRRSLTTGYGFRGTGVSQVRTKHAGLAVGGTCGVDLTLKIELGSLLSMRWLFCFLNVIVGGPFLVMRERF